MIKEPNLDNTNQIIHREKTSRESIKTDIKLLLLASQFKHDNFWCAYGGKSYPIKAGYYDGLDNGQGASKADLSHVLPHAYGGSMSVLNLMYLSATYNMALSDKLTFHALFEATRQGKTIPGESFYDRAEEFLYHWETYQFLIYAWPWWSRDETGRPILWGFDEKTWSFGTRKESYKLETIAKAKNVASFLKFCDCAKTKLKIETIFKKIYGLPLDAVIKKGSNQNDL